MKVANKSKLVVEKAQKILCPRCKGHGNKCDSKSECICEGKGEVWMADSGWFRAIYARIEDSQLY